MVQGNSRLSRSNSDPTLGRQVGMPVAFSAAAPACKKVEDDCGFFDDPITMEPMDDPVVCSNGHTYDRSTIKKMAESSSTGKAMCPYDRNKELTILIDNVALRGRLFEAYPKKARAYREKAARQAAGEGRGQHPVLNAPVSRAGVVSPPAVASLQASAPSVVALSESYARFEAGIYTLGSPPELVQSWDDQPRHQVQITQAFELQLVPVTQGQWLEVMGNNPSYFRTDSHGERALDRPVENVSYNDAAAFCAAKAVGESRTPFYDVRAMRGTPGMGNYECPQGEIPINLHSDGPRLPWESEWEIGARAGSLGATYAEDMNLRLDDIAWYSVNAAGVRILWDKTAKC